MSDAVVLLGCGDVGPIHEPMGRMIADIGGGTRDVLDDDVRAPERREAIGYNAADDIRRAAGRVGHNELDVADACRIAALRDGRAR